MEWLHGGDFGEPTCWSGVCHDWRMGGLARQIPRIRWPAEVPHHRHERRNLKRLGEPAADQFGFPQEIKMRASVSGQVQHGSVGRSVRRRRPSSSPVIPGITMSVTTRHTSSPSGPSSRPMALGASRAWSTP